MKHGVVNRTTDGYFKYQGWPTLAKDDRGVFYVACSGHRVAHVCPFGKNLVYISEDQGETWSAPMIWNDTPFDDRDAGLLFLNGGRTLLTYFNNPVNFYYERANWAVDNTMQPCPRTMTTGVLLDWKNISDERISGGSYLKIYDNYGKTLVKTIKMPITAPHGPCILNDGNLLYVGKECHSGIAEMNREDIYVYLSKNCGEEWDQIAAIHLPASVKPEECYFCEPHAVQANDGTIIAAIRAERSGHPEGFTTYLTYSDDGGHTWSEPVSMDCHGAPPHLMLHSSGAIVLTYGRRISPYGIRARISYDCGRSFGEEIVLRDDAPDWDVGYPSTVELKDGSLLTAYYQKYDNDNYPSILYTKWSL